MVEHSLKGKTALITGGAKNLGGAIAIDLAARGAKAIVIHYHDDESKLDAQNTLDAIRDYGTEAMAIKADLSSAAAMEELFATTLACVGWPDIAINTVGKVLKKPIVETSEDEFDAMLAVNTKTAFFFLKEAGRHVNDNGKVLNVVTSLLGAYTPSYALYEGAKAAVEHFTRAASKEFGERGISVNAIGPGPMDTPFFYGQESPEAQAFHRTAASLWRRSKTGLTDVDDILPWVRLLVSDGWWMTGQTILVNGGYTTK